MTRHFTVYLGFGYSRPRFHGFVQRLSLLRVGEQLTLEKSMPLAALPAGNYRLTIKVNDNISKQVIAPSADFAVE